LIDRLIVDYSLLLLLLIIDHFMYFMDLYILLYIAVHKEARSGQCKKGSGQEALGAGALLVGAERRRRHLIISDEFGRSGGQQPEGRGGREAQTMHEYSRR
jgi:hypothetical protein